MPDSSRDLFVRGLAAAKAGEIAEARKYLEWALRLNPPAYLLPDIWYWLSEVSSDKNEQRNYLEEILARDPGDARARRKLAVLDGRLDPKKIIDPDKLKPASDGQQSESLVNRFTCPTCGGKMVYTPDGMDLTCDYCNSRHAISAQGVSVENIPEDDFIPALATARGHLKSELTGIITCQGCGASFLFSPDQLSGNCPYCDSAYITKDDSRQEVIMPNSLIPFALDERTAQSRYRSWLTASLPNKRLSRISGRGVYLPCWTFDIGGQLTWRAELYRRKRWQLIQDQKIIYHNDILVMATRNLSDIILPVLGSFDLNHLVVFDPRFLSNWLAQTYDISLADASLQARTIALKRERPLITQNYQASLRNLNIITSSLQVESYRLILLPFWKCSYWIGQKRYDVFINGHNGYIYGSIPN